MQTCVLIEVLCDLPSITQLSLGQWDLLVRQARRADLLGRLAVLLDEQNMLDAVPDKPREHLDAARALADKHKQVISWEIMCIQSALKSLKIPIIYLKGAAYVLRELPPARGRLYADVDIMVPKTELGKVEKALLIHGWSAIKLDTYDQRYYREWMHELPPLRHRRRLTVIDVHHRILPETTKAQPDPATMLANAVPIKGDDKLKTLAPVDMVLHSAVHLFYEGELVHGLRDIVDLDDLFRYYSKEESFWKQIVSRALRLEQQMPLYYAMRYCNKIMQTPVPEQTWEDDELWRPGILRRSIMDFLFLRALLPEHTSCNKPFSGLARFLLYIRSHFLRMPVYLLIPHLLRKSFHRSSDTEI